MMISRMRTDVRVVPLGGVYVLHGPAKSNSASQQSSADQRSTASTMVHEFMHRLFAWVNTGPR